MHGKALKYTTQPSTVRPTGIEEKYGIQFSPAGNAVGLLLYFKNVFVTFSKQTKKSFMVRFDNY